MVQNRAIGLILALVVLLAGGLRFHRVGEPGFTEGADCMYTETARTLVLLAQWGWNHPLPVAAPGETAQQLSTFFAAESASPTMPYSAKPLYDFMNAVAVWIAGHGDMVLPAMSALMGTLSVAAIFLLGSRLYGAGVGLWAAALLAVSGGGLVFSRYGQSHMASILFFAIGFWFYLRSITPNSSLRALAGAGLFFGFALTTHPNLLPYVGLFALYEVALLARRQWGLRVFAQRAGLGCGILLLLGVLLNLPFLAIEHNYGAFFAQLAPQMERPFMTFFQQLPNHFSEVVTAAAPGFRERLYTYVVEAWAWEGTLVFGLVGFAVVRRLHTRARAGFADLIVYTQLVVPLLFWLFTENQAVLRYAAGTLPIALVVAARELDDLAGYLSGRFGLGLRTATALLCLPVMAYNVQHVLVVYQAGSAYKAAAAWLRAHGQTTVVVHHPRSYRFYGVTPLPLTTKSLGQAAYLAFYGRYLTKKEERVLAVLGTQEPVLVIPDRRPGKLLEVDLMEKSVVLKLLQELPGVGPQVREMRETVLERNRRRSIALYDITTQRAEIASVLGPAEQADLRRSARFSLN